MAEAQLRLLLLSVGSLAAQNVIDVARIAGLIREERLDLVIPTRDDDVLALALLAERTPGSRPALLTGSVEAARIMNDKAETARFAGRPWFETA